MKIFNVKSVDELKTFGNIIDVRKQVKSILGDNIRVKTRSWEELFSSIQSLKNLFNSISGNELKDRISDDLYFKGDAEKYIYILLEMDGKQRLKKLGVNRIHYSKKKISDKWRNEILKVIHPDVCMHPQAGNAMAELNEMYKEMIK